MGMFNKIKEPIFLKTSNSAEKQIEELKELQGNLNEEGKIRQDIKLLEYGIIGEKNIIYELKNSHMPMYILHDVYLQDGENTAQIDFLVLTKKICFIIECKNLYGNIEITNTGDFIRTIELNGRIRKEGIYSPVTQNNHHLQLLKKVKLKDKNFLFKFIINSSFDKRYKPVVVLANSKTIINSKYSKKEIKNQVIKVDQLIKYIKEEYKNSKETVFSDRQLEDWAKSFLDIHVENPQDYKSKYNKYINTYTDKSKIEDKEIYKELKEFRYKKSKEEGVKPYFIYKNSELEELIVTMPKTIEELKSINGFGEVKIKRYGEEILKIIENHC